LDEAQLLGTLFSGQGTKTRATLLRS